MSNTPDPCALCALLITTEEDRHVLHHYGGIRIFPEVPFDGWPLHGSCFAVVLEVIEKTLREGVVKETELTH